MWSRLVLNFFTVESFHTVKNIGQYESSLNMKCERAAMKEPSTNLARVLPLELPGWAKAARSR
jgi:hypothetical protein